MWSEPDLLLPNPAWDEEAEDKQTAGVGTTRKAIDGIFRQSTEAPINIKDKPQRKPQLVAEKGAVPIGNIVAEMSARRPEFAGLVSPPKQSRLVGFGKLVQAAESSLYRRAMGAGFMGAVVIVTGVAIISWLS